MSNLVIKKGGTMMDQNKGSAMFIKDSSGIKMGNVVSVGFDNVLHADNSEDISIENLIMNSFLDGNKQIDNEVIMELKQLVKDFSNKKDHKYQGLIQFIIAVGSASLVELLKTYGFIPTNK